MRAVVLFVVFIISCIASYNPAAAAPVSNATQSCLSCHEELHPGIVASWKTSRHARVTPTSGMRNPPLERRISADAIPGPLLDVVVGCAECHGVHADSRADAFDHNGERIHNVVSPEDCAVCHPQEREQFARSKMGNAHVILARNPLYVQLMESINASPTLTDAGVRMQGNPPLTNAESCYYCHGTRVEMQGVATRETAMGPMDFPVLTGRPNKGTGRINPDGSMGSCAACHTHHTFSIAMARKPYTCLECHNGPDVPAYKIYHASKHGNLYSSFEKTFEFDAVPWKVGEDFKAPTCATCHVSLITASGTVLARRTHAFNDRIPWRIFGLIYAHPTPIEADTSCIRNKDGLPLPTAFDATPASAFLIDAREQDKRKQAMSGVCGGCHTTAWTDGFWQRFEHTIETSNQSTRVAMQLIEKSWKRNQSKSFLDGGGLLDDRFKTLWSDVWLLHANHVRFASAMAGGGDYGVFAEGRYQLMQRLRDLEHLTK